MPEDRYSVGGLDRLRRLKDGAGAAPMGVLLDMRIVEIDDGIVVFQGIPNPEHLNPQGTVHGGWAATILDSALGCAVETKLGPQRSYGTIELKVNYVRALTPETGLVTCRAEVVHAGRQIATSEGRLVDQNGKLYAHGSCTCMIYDVR